MLRSTAEDLCRSNGAAYKAFVDALEQVAREEFLENSLAAPAVNPAAPLMQGAFQRLDWLVQNLRKIT